MMHQDDGYLAEPTGNTTGAGVLVLHDWYGLLPHLRSACDSLAGAGLVAFALDLYDGRTTSDPARAEELMAGLDNARAGARVNTAVAELRERTRGGPVGGLGFSMGGMLTLQQATTGTLDAAAVYYAALYEEQAAGIHCPVLLHFAEVDNWEPPDAPDRFGAALRAAGTQVESHTWPGTEHSFANGDVALHAPRQAADAWQITLDFLRGQLTPESAASQLTNR